MPGVMGIDSPTEYMPETGNQMAQTTELAKIKVPLGSQEIALQQIDHVEGGMSLMRIRIREGKRFTIFDIDPGTARQWADAMREWADAQEASSNG